MLSATKGRIEGLDLLRGIAIALVLIRHAWPEAIGTAGIVGVVSFFALSGYLITGLLVRDIRRDGRVRYGRFYRNRALRLIPPLVLMLAFFAIYTAMVNPLDDRGDIARSIIVGLSYTMNIPFDHGSPALSHLWTLATEEQFYIAWPLLLALGVRWQKLRWLVAGAALASLAVCATTIFVAAPSIGKVYTLPTSWAIAMIIGAAAKLGEERIERFLTPARRAWAGGIGLAGLLALSVLPEAKGSPATYLILAPGLPFSPSRSSCSSSPGASCRARGCAHARPWHHLLRGLPLELSDRHVAGGASVRSRPCGAVHRAHNRGRDDQLVDGRSSRTKVEGAPRRTSSATARGAHSCRLTNSTIREQIAPGQVCAHSCVREDFLAKRVTQLTFGGGA